ncbi:hypothetical protein AX16_008805 [Volvariella volvacea WC 439]|nr:hypothetical protein AX16_008805 [Volvariella volvacea WC 439]
MSGATPSHSTTSLAGVNPASNTLAMVSNVDSSSSSHRQYPGNAQNQHLGRTSIATLGQTNGGYVNNPDDPEKGSCGVPPQDKSNDPNKLDSREHETLAHKFLAMVAISTFSATAIISFISFARDIADWRGGDWELFQAMMFCGFMAAATHLLIIIMAGRAAVIAYRIAREEDQERNYWHYRDYFRTCQQFSLFAMAWFIVSVLIAIYGLFENRIYIYITYGYAGAGLLYILWLSPFRKDSILLGNLVFFREWVEKELAKQNKRERLQDWMTKKLNGTPASSSPGASQTENDAPSSTAVRGAENEKLANFKHPNQLSTPTSALPV